MGGGGLDISMDPFKTWLKGSRTKEALKSPYDALQYAKNIMKRRWPEAEAEIAKNPALAYDYAQSVIKGRWPEAEAVIAKNPQWAYRYAIDVLKSRFLEGEATIAQFSGWAFHYANDIIKDRWPEGEAAIIKDPWWTHEYARAVVKGRWPEGEASMMGRLAVWGDYTDRILESAYLDVSSFDEFIKHPDVIDLSDGWPLLKKVINGSPKALRTFYMDWAPKHIRNMMLRYEA